MDEYFRMPWSDTTPRTRSRFYALRLHECGRSSEPAKIIATAPMAVSERAEEGLKGLSGAVPSSRDPSPS